MKICHIGNLPIKKMGDITRDIFERCEGDHSYFIPFVGDLRPEADIYLLHCFKSRWDIYKNFRKIPSYGKCKIISLVHSSFPCYPSQDSDFIVTISQAAEKHLELTTNLKSTMIRGAIYLKPFLQVTPDYEFPVIGKISRNEPGKFHNQYFDILDIMSRKYGATSRMICPERPKDYGGELIQNVKINDPSGKAAALQKINIYADAHKTGPEAFQETFCIALLEAMAAGLPCVILGEQQPAMVEVLGDGGIVVENIYEFHNALETLVNSEQLRREYGRRARERAKEFSLDFMIKEYDELFQAAYNDL